MRQWVTAGAPQVLVEAATADGEVHSILLQNAETVRLVCPMPGDEPQGSGQRWCSVSVTEIQPFTELYVHMTQGARHTGLAIQQTLRER